MRCALATLAARDLGRGESGGTPIGRVLLNPERDALVGLADKRHG